MIGWLRRERSFRAYTTLRLHVISITTQVIDLLTTRAEDAAGGTMGMLRVAFAGTFSATLEPTVRARLGMLAASSWPSSPVSPLCCPTFACLLPTDSPAWTTR